MFEGTQQRLLEFIESIGSNPSAFEKSVGFSNGFVSKMGTTIRKENQTKISAVYPNLNMKWLLTGEGDMLVIEAGTANNNASNYLEERRNKKLAVNNFLVPLIPVKAQAGFLRAIDQTVYIDGLDKYALPPGIDPYGAVWAYWEIQGDSMEPTFHSGDYILATQVPRMDWDQLRQFYTYIIVTEEKILIKRIYPKTDQLWALISDNEEKYPQQLLDVETVKQVWVFRRHIDSKAPPPKKFEIKV